MDNKSPAQRVIPLNNSTPSQPLNLPEHEDLPLFLIERRSQSSLLIFAIKDTLNMNKQITALDMKKMRDLFNNQHGHYQLFLTMEEVENRPGVFEEQEILINPDDISSVEPAGKVRYYQSKGLVEEIK